MLGFGFLFASVGFVVALIWVAKELGGWVLDAAFSAKSELGRPLRLLRGDESYEAIRLLHEYLFDGVDGPWLAMWESVGLSQAELGRVAVQQ